MVAPSSSLSRRADGLVHGHPVSEATPARAHRCESRSGKVERSGLGIRARLAPVGASAERFFGFERYRDDRGRNAETRLAERVSA
jgi:hypothetical protein